MGNLSRKKWSSSLFSIVIGLLMSFVLLTAHFVFADDKSDQARFRINMDGANEAINIIVQELAIFTGDYPPSDRLKSAKASLKLHLDALRISRDQHDFSPPDLSKIEALCNGLGAIVSRGHDELRQVEQELEKTKKIQKATWKAEKQAELNVVGPRIGAQTDLLKFFASLGLSTAATAGMTGVDYLDFILGKLQQGSGGSPPIYRRSVQARLFLQQHQREIAERLNIWAKQGGHNISPQNLSKNSSLQRALILRIHEEVRLLAKKKYQQYQSRINDLSVRQTLLELVEIPRKEKYLAEFRMICEQIKKITLWQKRQPPPAVDNQGPDLSITSHNQIRPWSRVATRSITLTGTATDMNRGDSGIQSVYINSSLADSGSTASGNGTGNWNEVLKLSSGWNKITVEAHDNSPNYNKTQKVIWIYFGAPDAGDEPKPPPHPEPEAPFSAKIDCGDSFELSPNEILYPRICNVLVKGYNDSSEPVRVTVTYNNNILRVFPDDQSAQPYLMYPSTAGPQSGYYVFSINFSTTSTPPDGETSAVVIVRQGSSEVRFPLTILVLPPGQEPSSRTGIRPPAEVATGSAGSFPDAYCVWRYKSFGDRPECFNFVRAKCTAQRYSSSRYELVGSGMTRRESAARMAQLGSYHDDAYGCHTSTETDDWTDGTEQKPTTGQEDRTISALNVTPGSVTLKIGNSQSFTAISVYSDNSTEVASRAQWSGDEGVAGNTFTANEAGNFTITATYQGISSSASITVAEPVPTAIEISPRNSTIKSNKTVDFTATVTFDDGHKETNPDGLTWNPGSSFTGNEAGKYTITAEYRGKSGTATVTVQDLYGDAKAALQACDFEKSRSLIDQMLAGPNKTELEQEYQASLELENNLKAMVDQARNDYKSCNYDEALATLNIALSQTKCSKHIESIKNKITMADNRKVYEETTKRLHEEAKSLYNRKDYDGALAKLQEAYNHTKCDRYKNSLSSMIAKVQGKLKPSSEEQVAATDCSRYPGSRAYWDDTEGKYKCGCPEGYTWAVGKTHCEKLIPLDELCARDYPGSVARGRTSDGKVNCECPEGYSWAEGKTHCEKLISSNELCARDYPGSIATGRDATGKVNCDCPQGLRWNLNNSACVSQYDFAQEWCARNRPGSYVKKASDGSYKCQCPSGYVFGNNNRCVKKPTSGGGGGNRDWRGWDRNQQCDHLIFQIKGFMDMYKRDPKNNKHLKSIAESNAQQARTLGCNQNQINQALSTGGGGGGGGLDGVCPSGYYLGIDGTCTPVGSGTFGQ